MSGVSCRSPLVWATHQNVKNVEVHGDYVGDGADQVLLHAVENQHGEVGAQTQDNLQQQEPSQRHLKKEKKEEAAERWKGDC